LRDFMNNKTITKILDVAYIDAVDQFNKDGGNAFLATLKTIQRDWVIHITEKAETQKAAIAVLITCLAKKIENPKQDVRKHQSKMKNGFSGRTLDTQVITPFIKKKFRKFAMKESGWLTRSFEQDHPYNLNYRGAVRNASVKDAFLRILDDVEVKGANPKKYLIAIFIELIRQTKSAKKLFTAKVEVNEETTINRIFEALKAHFFAKYSTPGASRLPVLALYSIYQLLLTDVARYKDKKLEPLRSHTTSDVRENLIGDIEVKNSDNLPFEGVEVKHKIPISEGLVLDAYDKFRASKTKRYYLLTTAEPNIAQGEEIKVSNAIMKIRQEHGCEVIVNGVMNSLKYYLRLLKNPSRFVELYSQNLRAEFEQTTDIKQEHILEWNRILKERLK